MDGETFLIEPNAVVILGFRSVLSLIGLTTAVAGYWMMERKWENDGAAVLLRRPMSSQRQQSQKTGPETGVANQNHSSNKHDDNDDSDDIVAKYMALPEPPSQASDAARDNVCASAEMVLCGQMFHENGCRDFVRVGTCDSFDRNYHPTKAPADPEGENMSAAAAQYYYAEPSAVFQAKLEAAMPLPVVLLVGCGLWSLSLFLDPSIGGFRLYINVWNVLGFLLAALVGPIIAYPVRQATLERNTDRKQKACVSLVVVLVLLVGVVIADPKVQNARIWYISVIGVMLLVGSYPILQHSCRMGRRWDLKGKPKSNDEIFVHTMGTPLLFWGVALFWIGTNSVQMADLNFTYLPLFTNVSRSWVVFVAGMLMIVPAQLALDLAFDQGSELVAVSESYSIYKLDGSTVKNIVASVEWLPSGYIGTALESPIWWSLGWILMALCCFLPFGVTSLTIQQFCAMSICVAMAPLYACFVVPAFWKNDLTAFPKCCFVYCAVMISWAVAIGINGGIALILSFMGVFLVLAGQRFTLFERKRGIPRPHLPMIESSPHIDGLHTPNPSPQVYGIGHPLYAIGWFLLCLSMSVPM
mmetsp:Transcript_471/g.878  ORF Transcript_471/g.878 Transcript_471/m.878 type:complete len:584 (+) Transcript_471:32-1783(+)